MPTARFTQAVVTQIETPSAGCALDGRPWDATPMAAASSIRRPCGTGPAFPEPPETPRGERRERWRPSMADNVPWGWMPSRCRARPGGQQPHYTRCVQRRGRGIHLIFESPDGNRAGTPSCLGERRLDVCARTPRVLQPLPAPESGNRVGPVLLLGLVAPPRDGVRPPPVHQSPGARGIRPGRFPRNGLGCADCGRSGILCSRHRQVRGHGRKPGGIR
jgi:hypothetical protein